MPPRNHHAEFIEQYFIHHFNATAAYMATYPKSSYGSARRSASELLTKPDIRKEIAGRLSENKVEADMVLKMLTDQAKSSLKPFIVVNKDGFVSFDFNQPGAMENIHLLRRIKSKRSRRLEGRGDNKEEWEDEVVDVELVDSQGALEKLGRHLNLFDDKPPAPILSLHVEGFDKILDKIYGPKNGNGNGKHKG